jgi:flagellar hook-length control protein FliK
MPQTSAVTLLPPTPIQSNTSSSYSQASDSSFQDSLDSATQAQSSKTDQAPTAPAKPPEKTAKKPTKAAKSKTPAGSSDSTTVKAGSKKPSDEPLPIEEEVPTEEAPKPTSKKDDSMTEDGTTEGTPDAAVVAAAQLPVPLQAPVQVVTNSPQAASLHKVAPAIVKAVGTQKSAQSTKENANTAAPSSQKAGDTQGNAPESDKSDDSDESDTSDSSKATIKPVGFLTDAPDAANPEQAKSQTASGKPHAATADSSAAQQATNALPAAADDSQSTAHASSSGDVTTIAPAFEQHFQNILTTAEPKAEAPAPASPETQFIDANHPAIVTGVQTQLLPDGGTMQLHLNPPEMGALQVTVQMHAGVMSAAFETSNDEATRMLSHSLGQLKTALESTGVSVEKMQVQQSPKQQSSSNNADQQQQKRDPEEQQNARQEQQRRQMLQRMWNKLAGVEDPLDLVA